VVRTVNPYLVDWTYDGPNEVHKEEPQPHHVWYAPFHEATKNDGLEPHSNYGNGPTTVGTVSE
jgi:hypothetical protein